MPTAVIGQWQNSSSHCKRTHLMEVRGQLRASADLVKKKCMAPTEWARWVPEVCVLDKRKIAVHTECMISPQFGMCSPVTTSIMLFRVLQFERIIECTL